MKLLVIGGGGQLGSKILQQARDQFELYATYITRIPQIKQENVFKIDKTDLEGIRQVISKIRPDFIIDTAALHNVDYCETHKDEARAVNEMGTKNVAETCEESDAKMVFISTDYVFDGLKGSYVEDDPANPVNYYGLSKLEGEKAVMNVCEDYLIARPSVIYGWISSSTAESSSGKPLNFAMWLTKKLQNREKVNIVSDQYSSPTLSDNLATTILDACQRDVKGIYHIAGKTRLNRYEFAIKIAEKMNLDPQLVNPIETSRLKQLATRPMDSSLKVDKIEKTLRTSMASIDEALEVFCRQAERDNQ